MRARELYRKIELGLIDDITLREYMEVSFLLMFSGEEPPDYNQPIFYRGNTFYMHSCIEHISTGQNHGYKV